MFQVNQINYQGFSGMSYLFAEETRMNSLHRFSIKKIAQKFDISKQTVFRIKLKTIKNSNKQKRLTEAKRNDIIGPLENKKCQKEIVSKFVDNHANLFRYYMISKR